MGLLLLPFDLYFSLSLPLDYPQLTRLRPCLMPFSSLERLVGVITNCSSSTGTRRVSRARQSASSYSTPPATTSSPPPVPPPISNHVTWTSKPLTSASSHILYLLSPICCHRSTTRGDLIHLLFSPSLSHCLYAQGDKLSAVGVAQISLTMPHFPSSISSDFFFDTMRQRRLLQSRSLLFALISTSLVADEKI